MQEQDEQRQMTQAEKNRIKQRANTKKLFKKLVQAFRTPPDMTVTEWADAYRYLSPEAAAEPGKYYSERAPYQRELMNAVSDPKCWKVVIMTSAQIGKALDINTPIPTPNGWCSMGDLNIGDTVFDEQGKQCKVTFATEIMYNRKCYEVEFSDGSKIVADAEHNWYVESDTPIRKEKENAIWPATAVYTYNGIITTDIMANTYKYGRDNHRNRYAIPVAGAIECNEKELLIDPYLLGVWLGDGTSESAVVTVSVNETELIDNIKSRCNIKIWHKDKRESAQCVFSVLLEPKVKGKTCFNEKLRKENLIKNKHIPEAYLRAGYAQRVDLLQGIMDTDGSCNKNGRCEITLKSKKLIDGVAELLAGLGIKYTLKEKIASATNGNKGNWSKVYRISFLAYDDFPVFKLKRKLERQPSRIGRRTTETERRRIVCVREVESRPVKCIQVDSENHLYLAGKAMIPTHNTTVLENMIGYHIDYDPCPILSVNPTDSMAGTFSKDRISPMIRDTPALKKKVEDAKSRNTGNTIYHKKFPGGHLTFVGANTPSQLASRPIRVVVADEIDRFPDSAGTEGDPLQLAIKRTTTFWNRKIIEVSTPTIKGASKIEKEYESSSQEELNVACPNCGKFQPYVWEQLKFEHESGTKNFKMLGYRCAHCGEIEREIIWKKQPIKWIAGNPEVKDVRGFHLNELASPWKHWDEIVADFLEAKRQGREMLKVWHNTALGLPWEEDGDLDIKDILLKRRMFYNCEVPNDALVLTCGVDVQDNRLEYEIKGWGKDKRSWGIKYGVLMGSPGQHEVWEMLDDVLFANYKRADGQELQIMTTCIDSGGHYTNEVYAYCRKREMRRVWAIKGQGGSGIPYVKRPSRRNQAGVWLFMIGVDVGKDTMAARLKTDFPEEPGFCYYPMEPEAGYDEQYFEGLTAERREIRTVNGRIVINWKKKYDGARNEPWDIANYCSAALEILNPNLERLHERLNGGGATHTQPQKAKTKRISKGIDVF